MERALSQEQEDRSERPHPLNALWLLLGWLALIAFSWGLIALPLLLWGWQGFWAYLLLASLCILFLGYHRPRHKA